MWSHEGHRWSGRMREETAKEVRTVGTPETLGSPLYGECLLSVGCCLLSQRAFGSYKYYKEPNFIIY